MENRRKLTLPAKSTEWDFLRSCLMNGTITADLAEGKIFFEKKHQMKE
jgi:hypothetical protein